MSTIRRVVAVAAIAATASISLAGSPASADKPIIFPDGQAFDEPDPCNPSTMMTTTLTLEVRGHVGHPNNGVFKAKLSAVTSNGYSGKGNVIEVGGERFFSANQRVMVSNPETGQRYIVKAKFTVNANGITVDNFGIVCLRGFVDQA